MKKAHGPRACHTTVVCHLPWGSASSWYIQGIFPVSVSGYWVASQYGLHGSDSEACFHLFLSKHANPETLSFSVPHSIIPATQRQRPATSRHLRQAPIHIFDGSRARMCRKFAAELFGSKVTALTVSPERRHVA
jgi:hypothetical protein